MIAVHPVVVAREKKACVKWAHVGGRCPNGPYANKGVGRLLVHWVLCRSLSQREGEEGRVKLLTLFFLVWMLFFLA